MSLGAEDLIQISIVDWLKLVKPEAIVFHVPNGAKMSKPTARRMKRLGMLAGVPDLVMLIPDHKTLFFEVKTPKGPLSDAQKWFGEQVEKQGYHWSVVRSIDDVRTEFRTLGIKVREVEKKS